MRDKKFITIDKRFNLTRKHGNYKQIQFKEQVLKCDKTNRIIGSFIVLQYIENLVPHSQ